MSTQPWIAHEYPERPLERGAWICDCQACEIALRASIAVDPGLQLVAKSETGRRVFTSGRILLPVESSGLGSAMPWSEIFVA